MDTLQFFDPDWQDGMTVGRFPLNAVFKHSLFISEGFGFFLQLMGLAMGTNAAPMWANLTPRAFELI